MSPGSHDLWGRAELRGRSYKAVPYEALPALPPPTAEPFAWLRASPTRGVREQLKVGLDGEGRLPRPPGEMVEKLVGAAKGEGLTVPSSYATFMTDASLHERVPTCTACYLDIPAKLVAVPGGRPGKLLRFLNDQQGAVVWSLHLTPDGACSVVVAEPVTPRDVATCAPTFEEFVHRFWMENTLWFSLFPKTQAPLTPLQQEYLDAVKKVLPSL